MSDLLQRIDLRFDLVKKHMENYIVGPSGCWEFQGKKKAGSTYGQLTIYSNTARVPKRMFSAHRVSYAFHNGIDPESLSVMHSCDNPICINPEHLELGTHKKNMQEMADRKRSTIGEINPNHKITEADVIAVVERIKAGESNMAISKDLPISHAMVSQIRHKKNWIHLLDSIGYDPALHRRRA